MFKKLFGKKEEIVEVASGEEIRIGVIADRTGITSAYSEMAVRGFGMAIEYATNGSWKVGNRTLRMIVEDDRSDPEVGLVKAQKLMQEDDVHILQGCTGSGVTARLVRGLELDRLFMIAVAATDVVTGEWRSRYVFRTASCTGQDAAAGAKYAVDNLGRRFSLLAPASLWGRQSRAAWWNIVKAQGGEIVGDLIEPPHEKDFRDILERVLDSKPDVFVPSWIGPNISALFMQMREVGIFDKMKVAGGLVENSVLEEVGDAVEGMICMVKYYHAFPKNPVNDWLVARHQERYGTTPDLFTESGFSSGIALVEGLKRTNADTNVEKLIATLEGMSFVGPKGSYTFRKEDHQALQPMYVAELVSVEGQRACQPTLIKEVSPNESAPPMVALES